MNPQSQTTTLGFYARCPIWADDIQSDEQLPILSDKLEVHDLPRLQQEKAIQTALEHRTELQAQKKRIKLAMLTKESIKGERLPSLDLRGDYGLIGQHFDQRFGTYNFGAFLSIPIFDGGQREGRIQESNSQLRQEIIRASRLVQQIKLEVRDALLTLETTREQVLVSQETLELALKELELSQKAFSIGTLTHIEVLNAQTGVAEARDRAIEALFNFNAARINLARAQGKIDQIYHNPKQFVYDLYQQSTNEND